ncbi:hypothetical protein [Phenylobacterium immobile]|uniref:hypothetical protein n=1 Tax=Phenylobacterium immobile TaxID=21 RepID=UPI000A66171F|nr:hypothetical protein [Phenylobacterium immobile]
MNVALVFFGLARVMPSTVASIYQNVVEPLRADGHAIQGFAAMNLVEAIWNPRSGEFGVKLNSGPSLDLPCDVFAYRKQKSDLIEPYLTFAKARKDMYEDDFKSVSNILYQLVSLRAAWSLLEASGKTFDRYVFLRPDLRWLNPLVPAELFPVMDEKSAAIPAWHGYGGFNDRIAVCGHIAAKAYGERVDLVEEYTRKAPLHPERLVAYALSKVEGEICNLPIRGVRVRSETEERRENFEKSVLDLRARPEPFAFHRREGVTFPARAMAVP